MYANKASELLQRYQEEQRKAQEKEKGKQEEQREVAEDHLLNAAAVKGPCSKSSTLHWHPQVASHCVCGP